MPLTGLFAISISPGESSPSAALVSHISRSYPAASLPTFHLDNRLFVDTSSLHPKSNVGFTQVYEPTDPFSNSDYHLCGHYLAQGQPSREWTSGVGLDPNHHPLIIGRLVHPTARN